MRRIMLSLTLLLATSALVPTATRAETIPVPRRSVWKYATGVSLGTAWRQPSFDDSVWAAGPGLLGFGETTIATTVPFGPDANNKYPTCYFRHEFTYDGDPASLLGFVVRVNYDDGFAAYLNGQEIARNLVAQGAPYAALATGSHESGIYESFDIQSHLGARQLGQDRHRRRGHH